MVQKKRKKSASASKRKSASSTQRRRTRRRGFWFLFYLFVALFCTVGIYLFYCWLSLPDLEEVVSRTRQPSTTVIAENGNEIFTFGNSFSEVVYLQDLPYYLPAAVVDVEDKRFYRHFGFDIIGFTRAMLVNLMQRRYAQGASTISQQVAKNLFLTPQKSIQRKVQELLLAFWLEYKFTKEQILTLYLNRVYLGTGVYGVEAAANRYFGKSARDLSLKESAVIAGMLKAPSRYNPISSLKKAQQRSSVVLKLMFDHGTITSTEYKKALHEPLYDTQKYKVEGARHFADMVYSEVNAYLGERHLDVYVSTTLDQTVQQKTERLLNQFLHAHRAQNVTQGAVVILDHQGAVKALVGGLNYHKSQFNRASQALRQPGSAFKPFVYITALQYGMTPDDLLEDQPLRLGKWKPENYDRKFHGTVTMREALTQSLNVATVSLLEKINLKDIIRNARRMGITTPMQNTPALVLGASAVKVMDMAAAYACLANGGFAVFPYVITEIYSRDGMALYQREITEPQRILDAKNVADLTQMMQAVIQHGTGKKAALPFFAAGKTGTTQDYRDAWFVGWTKDYVTAIWMGNDDNSPMKGVTGGTLPAELWGKIMKEISS